MNELLQNLHTNKDRYQIHDEWSLNQYRLFMESGNGYPYLESVAEWIEKQNNLTLTTIEHKNLVTLVYNAAAEYREEKDKREGYFSATADILPSLVGKKLYLRRESIFGNYLVLGKIVYYSGRYFFLPKGKRSKGYWLDHTMKLKQEA